MIVVFSSPTFLFAFLPLTLLLTTLVPARLRNTTLLSMSVLFYLWGAADQIDVIVFVSLAAWVGALALSRPRLSARAARVLTAVSVAVVLAPLLWFKYVPSVTEMAQEVGLSAGGDRFKDLLIPLGISFFTFHGISYVVDVRRGLVPAERNPVSFALYLFLFPHQIAGPIVRYSEIRDEIRNVLRPTREMALEGMSRFAWGLAKKAFVADSCGVVANAVYRVPGERLDMTTAWLGVLAYALQIYFDFSAYSDMAIGLAKMLGFHFPENFAGPYRSVSVTEFWRRWHMTLSRWFRDYVYIPFGGNRRGAGREYGGLLLTFLLTSLWHGASWTFLLWGGIHSGALLLERVTGLRRSERLVLLRRAAMVVFILLSWVPFRAPTVEATGTMYAALAGLGGRLLAVPPPTVLVACTPWNMTALIVGCLTFLVPGRRPGYQWLIRRPAVAVHATGTVRTAAAVAMTAACLPLAVLAVFWNDFSPFLYFRF